jgi:hypothetical protein
MSPEEQAAAVKEWQKALAEKNGTAPSRKKPRTKKDNTGRKSASTQLVELVGRSGAELFHSPDQAAFARVTVGHHKENWQLKGTGFRRWLNRLYFQSEGRAAGGQAVQDALSVLEGQACFEGPEKPVAVRLAEYHGATYLDLGDSDWRTVEIDRDGWRIVADSPVRFRRPKGLLALPEPVPGGKVEDLRPFLNLATNDDWYLIVGWIIQALRPRGPYPALGLHGQQGSAKSTHVSLLRRLIDPNLAELRSEPKEPRDLMIAATNSWVLSFDNLSHLSLWLSDALCRLATGGGFATRELYSDAEETIFNAQRPVILNGIEDLATCGDLLERSVLLNLPAIPERKRRPERAFWREFEAARPHILGALLTAVAGAHRELPHVRLSGLPRMADFAEWAVAAERGQGWKDGSFLAAYRANRTEANEVALESSPLVGPLREFLARRGGQWEGSAGDLLQELTALAGDTIAKSKEWPHKGHVLSGQLKRLAPNLRAVGIVVEWDRATDAGRARILRVFQQEKFRDGASRASEVSEASTKHGESGKGAGRSLDASDAPSDASSDASQSQKTPSPDTSDASDAPFPDCSDLDNDFRTPWDDEGEIED